MAGQLMGSFGGWAGHRADREARQGHNSPVAAGQQPAPAYTTR